MCLVVGGLEVLRDPSGLRDLEPVLSAPHPDLLRPIDLLLLFPVDRLGARLVQEIALRVHRAVAENQHEIVGQNAVQQGKFFAQAVQPTGLIVTKLDGTARGGAVVALRRELAVPIRFLGTGETPDDLQVFDAEQFADELIGSDGPADD